MRIKKKNLYIIIPMILVIAAFTIIVMHNFNEAFKLQKIGRYTIATVHLRKGIIIDNIYVTFEYKGVKEERDCSAKFVRNLIGKKIIIQIDPGDREFVVGSYCEVPDSLSAPSEGWDNAWLQKNFPDCYAVYHIKL